MNKYIITSPAFTGEINVLYGEENKLMFIDFLRCVVSEEQISYFKAKLPASLEPSNEETNEAFLLKQFGVSKLHIVAEGYTVTFEQFWNRYGIKRNRSRAEKNWNKMSEASKVHAFVRIPLYERFLALNEWRGKAEPDNYLSKRYWENDWSK